MQALADVLSGLPDDAERTRLLANLDVVAKFFGDLRRRVETLPSSNERAKVQGALEEVAGFLGRARENQILAAALGIAYERVPTRSGPAPSQPSRSAQALLNEVRELPTNEILATLNDYKRVTMRDLHSLASLLGLKLDERLKREDLVDRIVKLGFANIRGYDLLRGVDSPKAPKTSL
jgi:hypothetical protein